MASAPTQYPVYLVGPGGQTIVVLDLNGYNAALAAGATPYSAVVPSTTAISGDQTTVVAQLPLSPVQSLPASTGEVTSDC